jgi:site-specific DNA recombinase
LESVVLDGLRERLMDPVLFQEFAVAFTVEWNRLQGATSHEHEARQAELQRVRQQIERLIDAITEGTPAAAVHGRLAAAEQRRLALEAEMARAIAPAPRLHPNLAEVYRAKVATLADSLSRDDATEARELVRGLVERVTLSPDGTTQRIEIRGELAAILGLAGAANGHGSSGSAAVLSEQVKVVAGTGFEPVTFRL